MVNVTLVVTRIFSYELRNFERKEQLAIKDDNAANCNRQNFWVGSCETVLVPEFLPMQQLTHFVLLLAKGQFRIYQISS